MTGEETVEFDKKEEESVVQSVENLTELSQEIKSVKSRRNKNLNNNKLEDNINNPHLTGIIVPKPYDKHGPSTGDIRNGKVCLWIKNKKTGDYFYEWLDYPNSEKDFVKNNEYIRLCKYIGMNTENTQDMLYKKVPITTENIELTNETTLHLPDYGTKISSFSHKSFRVIHNILYRILNMELLMIFLNLFIYYLLFKSSIGSIPDQIPTSHSESMALGYSEGVGIIVFSIYVLILSIIGIINLKISVEYVPSKLRDAYNNTRYKINNLLDDEYIE